MRAGGNPRPDGTAGAHVYRRASTARYGKEQVQTQTGGELVVEGETELSLFPRFALRLESTSLNLSAQTEYEPDIEASIAELDVGLSPLPLLSGNVDVGTIVIAGVTADITEPQALPPAPEPRPVMSDREWEKARRNHPTDQGGRAPKAA